MRKKISNVLWALVLIAVGVILILNALGVAHITLFAGWWTLFLIVPALLSMVRSGLNAGNLILLGVGAVLLLHKQGVFQSVNLWALLLGVVVVMAGLGILFRKAPGAPKVSHKNAESYTYIFGGGSDVNTSDDFRGAVVTNVFGGGELDLRGARLTQDATVRVTSVFGGGKLFVPAGVNIKVSGTCILGGYDNHVTRSDDPALPTLFVECTCIFGGEEICA